MTTTLLAVDDSKTMRKVLEITFAGEDYRTVLAASADDALEKLRAEQPRIALLDAGINGYDLCQRIKSEAPGTGVIILSNRHQPYDRARGSSVRADDFIDKPFDTQVLLDKVAALSQKLAAAGPAVQAPAAVAPPAVAPPAVAPHVAPHAPAVRQRTQTLAYGTPSGAPGVVPSAVPNQPAPAASRPQVARPPVSSGPVRPAFSGAPAQVQPTPQPAPVRPAPRSEPAEPLQAERVPVSSVKAPVRAATAENGQFSERLQGLGLDEAQVKAVLALSREVVEQVVWEVVPTLAETIIKEEIRRLTSK